MFVWALLLNLFFFFFRIFYVLYYPIDLSPEEAQYWDWSRELDLSYYSKPPMVAYMNALSTALLGNTEIGVRINAITLSFLLSVATYFFARRLFGEKVAFFSSVLPNLFVGFSLNSVLFTTDSPLLFFWGLSLMVLYFAVERNTTGLWILLGVLGGLAFLSKYPAVFLLPVGLAYLYLVRRELLLSPRPYLSVLVAFFISLPVILWNLERDFASFRHVSSLAGKKASFPNLSSFGEFLGGQLILLSVVPFFLLLWGWYLAFRERRKELLFLALSSLLPLSFFLFLSLFKRVYANWAGFSYFGASLLIAYVFVRSPLWIRLSAVFWGLFLTTLLHFTPLLDRVGLRELLPPKRDPTKFLVGWEKLGREVSEYYTGREMVLSNVYQISAELAFYVKGNPRTFVYHTGRLTQYYYWREKARAFRGRDALFVGYGGVPEGLMRSFGRKEFLGKVEVFWRGEKVREFYIFKLKKFSGEFYESPKGY
ncbi:MAG: glycosyltransferase family 39 protein [Aquificae bacterium]|nr:glycosyltransferase family 39 protein [Aquificota bacterium]